MSSIQVTPLTTQQINELSTCFYVMNNSDSNRKRPRGIVHLSAKENDQDASVALPNTWLPINLVDYFSLDSIKRSRDIRQTIQAGVIVVISEAEATQILATPGARDEISRVREEMQKSRGSSGFMLGETGEKVTISTSGNTAIGTTIAVDTAMASGGLNPVLAVVERYNAGGDERSAINELFTMAKGGLPMVNFEEAAGKIPNTSSKLYLAIGDIIGGATEPAREDGASASATFPS